MPSDFHITTRSQEETHELGRRIGKTIDAPLAIALTGDLGSGKTALIKGLAEGLDVPPEYYVTSPTYTIVNEYPGRFRLFHLDLYRISDPLELEDIGFDDILGGIGVVAIEWAERLEAEDFSPDVVIHMLADGPTARQVSIFFYGPATANLVEGLKNHYQSCSFS